jgi:hypothetical protein
VPLRTNCLSALHCIPGRPNTRLRRNGPALSGSMNQIACLSPSNTATFLPPWRCYSGTVNARRHNHFRALDPSNTATFRPFMGSHSSKAKRRDSAAHASPTLSRNPRARTIVVKALDAILARCYPPPGGPSFPRDGARPAQHLRILHFSLCISSFAFFIWGVTWA